MLALLQDEDVALARDPGQVPQAIGERVPVAAEPVGKLERAGQILEEVLLVVRVADVDAERRQSRLGGRLGERARVALQLIHPGPGRIAQQPCYRVHGSPIRVCA